MGYKLLPPEKVSSEIAPDQRVWAGISLFQGEVAYNFGVDVVYSVATVVFVALIFVVAPPLAISALAVYVA